MNIPSQLNSDAVNRYTKRTFYRAISILLFVYIVSCQTSLQQINVKK